MNAVSPNVFLRGGDVVANSRDVAAFFEKRHDHVLRDIDNLLESLDSPKLGSAGLFIEMMLPDAQGINRRSFDMTKDGFALLAMGFNGDKALKFKLAYIQAFNRMEEALRSAALPPPRRTAFEIPTDDIRAWSRLVTEARILKGKAAALAVWDASPLPSLPDGDETEGLVFRDQLDLDPEGCLRHLLEWCPIHNAGPVKNLLENEEFHRRLLNYGIRARIRGFDGYFAVSRKFPPLTRLYAKTRWSDAWANALLELPGARRHQTAVWFGTTATKVVLLPLGA